MLFCIGAAVPVLVQIAKAQAPPPSTVAAFTGTADEDGQWPMPAKNYAKAVDAYTGKEVWKVSLGDVNR